MKTSAFLAGLKFKPGIQRDGSQYQGDYLRDGNLIRFQKRGNKAAVIGMGNLSTLENAFIPDVDPTEDDKPGGNPSLIFALNCETTEFPSEFLFTASSTNITCFLYSADIQKKVASIDLDEDTENEKLIWQAVEINSLNADGVLFIGTYTKLNMFSNVPSLFYVATIQGKKVTFQQLNRKASNIDDEINGGACFSHNFLFLYGSKGLVQYTNIAAVNNFKDIKFGTSQYLKISSKKVIYGAPIRGGATSPTILVWTQSQVIRLINQGSTDPELQADFKVDEVTRFCSVASQKSIIQHDGLFYWLGKDRFYIYNGNVQSLDNSMNREYLLNNLGSPRADDYIPIFAVKWTSKNEIWWIITNNLDGFKQVAIIYNITLNAWYDAVLTFNAPDNPDKPTKFNAVVYSEENITPYFLGYIPTSTDEEFNSGVYYYGVWQFIDRASGVKSGLTFAKYNYNEETDSIEIESEQEVIEDSFVTTPVYSLASFNPLADGQQANLLDRRLITKRIEADFANTNNYQEDTTVKFYVLQKDYAGELWGPETDYFTMSYTKDGAIINETAKDDESVLSVSSDVPQSIIPLSIQSRNLSFKITFDSFIEIGNFLMSYDIGDTS